MKRAADMQKAGSMRASVKISAPERAQHTASRNQPLSPGRLPDGAARCPAAKATKPRTLAHAAGSGVVASSRPRIASGWPAPARVHHARALNGQQDRNDPLDSDRLPRHHWRARRYCKWRALSQTLWTDQNQKTASNRMPYGSVSRTSATAGGERETLRCGAPDRAGGNTTTRKGERHPHGMVAGDPPCT